MDGRDCAANGCRVSGIQATERHLRSVHEFIDDGAGSVDRSLTGERGHRKVESGSHSGREGAQCDEVGRLLGLRALIAGEARDPVPSVATGEKSGIEIALLGTESGRLNEVEAGHSRSGERG
jgi:hypothetical protein